MGVLTDARQHRYQACRDGDCERFACRVYREGYEDGYQDGQAAGFAEGHAAGFSEGHAEGYAAGASSASEGG